MKIELLPETDDGYKFKAGDIIIEISATAKACWGIKSMDEFDIENFFNYIQENARSGFTIKRESDFLLKSISVDSEKIQGGIVIDGKEERRLFSSNGLELCKKFIRI